MQSQRGKTATYVTSLGKSIYLQNKPQFLTYWNLVLNLWNSVKVRKLSIFTHR